MEHAPAGPRPEGPGWRPHSNWRTGFPRVFKNGTSPNGWWRLAAHPSGPGPWQPGPDGHWMPASEIPAGFEIDLPRVSPR